MGKGAPLAFRRGHSVTRLCPFYALLLCAFTLLPLGGKAQDLPPRAIRIVVPSPPGAAGDISARLIGQKLSEGLRQPVVVENQAGASGAIGMSMLRRAAPDGTTVGVVIALAQTIDRIQNKKASFDIVKDFTPITAIANNPAGLVVNSRLTAASLSAFVDLVRKRPREISYASGGIGTAHHLYGQILNRTAGIEMLYVPYKGVAPAVNDVLGGHVPAAMNFSRLIGSPLRAGSRGSTPAKRLASTNHCRRAGNCQRRFMAWLASQRTGSFSMSITW